MTKYKRIHKPHPSNGLIDYIFDGKEDLGGIHEIGTHRIHDISNVELVSEPIKEIPKPISNPFINYTNEFLIQSLIKTSAKHYGKPEFDSITKNLIEEINMRMGEAE